MRTGIPKGRLISQLNGVFFQGRKLFNEERTHFLLKPNDIPHLVSSGALEIGYATEEVLVESEFAGEKTLINVLPNRLCLLGKPDKSLFKGCTIATQYPKSTKATLGNDVNVLTVSGAAEAYIELGLADFIVDVVSSGATAKENGLVILEELFVCSLYRLYRSAK